MQVSVVIPFYSNINWLEEAIISVKEQSYKNYEIVIVNDGSPEDDTEFLSKYSNEIKYFKIKNGGPAVARNFGIQQASGEFIAFLDSDDLWTSDKLEVQMNYMKKENAVWSHTNYSTFNVENQVIEHDLMSYNGFVFPLSLYSMHVATPSVIVKRSILLEEEFKFQEKMRFGQDYYLWLVLSEKYPILLVRKSLCKVRLRGTNANLRARAHLQVRGQIWMLLRETSVFELKRFGLCTKLGYSWCSTSLKFVVFLESLKLSKNITEWISKFLYFPAYVVFQSIFKKIR